MTAAIVECPTCGAHAIPGDELEDDLFSGDMPPREH